MSQSRPIRERELLIDDEIRSDFRQTIDPRIDYALRSRGYTEEHAAANRNYLDGSQVIPSAAFRKLYERPFDGLSVSTEYDVYENERTLTRSSIDLSRIGGFSASRIVTVGGRYFTSDIKVNQRNEKTALTRLSAKQTHDILQDIRAHTDLGYSSSDTDVPIPQLIGELEGLHSNISVDQRAHYQLMTSKEHGDIQMNIGKSFELRDAKSDDHIKKRSYNTKRLFEIIAKQPLEGGMSTVGIHYRSGRGYPEIKITAEIDSDAYTEEEKQELYNDVIRSYQEKDIHKFGQGVLANLAMISDTDSNILRLG